MERPVFERQNNGHNILFKLIVSAIVGIIAYLILAISFNLDFVFRYDSSIIFIITGIIVGILAFALLEKT